MARNHWRFVVRDAYGYAIQNAKVNVYQPDTTTAFLGTAYTSLAGGTTASNPFTTNAQGEVEAWFDTAQEVDVQVDDNSDTAYRAVEGAAQTISFTTFTEDETIDDAPANVQAHGASYHTNITRTFFLPVLDVVTDGGTIAVRGTPPAALRVLTLPDAATNGMQWWIAVPSDAVTGAPQISIVHAGQTTTGGAVRWSIATLYDFVGSSIVSAGSTVNFTGATLATTDVLVAEAAQAGEIWAAGDYYRISVRRVGADGADTYAASTSLIGIKISYTANQ